jgi:hypothetical protein
VAGDRRAQGGDGQLSEDERAELVRLRRENAELAMAGRWGSVRRGSISGATATLWPGMRGGSKLEVAIGRSFAQHHGTSAVEPRQSRGPSVCLSERISASLGSLFSAQAWNAV